MLGRRRGHSGCKTTYLIQAAGRLCRRSQTSYRGRQALSPRHVDGEGVVPRVWSALVLSFSIVLLKGL
jgi:hypothetical protein